MNVTCLFKEENCKWLGTIEELKTHLAKECQYVELECPNEEC